MLGRTAVTNNSQADDAVHAIQAQYKLTPLSRWKHANLPAADAPRAEVPIGLNYHDTRGAWATMNRAMTENPPGVWPAIDQLPLLNLFATIGIGPGQRLAAQSDATLRGLTRAAKDGLALLQKMAVGRGKTVNQWNYPPLDIGRAGMAGDYITRSALQALGGIVANDPAEAVYINTDGRDEPTLTGAARYDLFRARAFRHHRASGFGRSLYNGLTGMGDRYTVRLRSIPGARRRRRDHTVPERSPQTPGDGVALAAVARPGGRQRFTIIHGSMCPGGESTPNLEAPKVARARTHAAAALFASQRLARAR